MSTWSEASALCDLAIETLGQVKYLRGAEREAAWKTPKKILGAIGVLLSDAMPEPERALAAQLEFEAIQSAGPGKRLWPISAGAWRAGVGIVGVSETAGLALGRLSAAVKKAAGRDDRLDHFETRKDVGGKLLRIMREGSLAWVEEDGRAGHVGPTGRALSDWALELHGRWCAQLGVLAEWDWEKGVNAYGFGLWLGEMESGGGGKFERWGNELIAASERALSQFGRLPRLPEGSGTREPPWTLLENYAAHEGGDGVCAHNWAWCSRFPLIGVEPWDIRWGEQRRWDLHHLSDPLRGRALMISSSLAAQGLGHLRGDFERWQGRWAAQLESQEIERGLDAKDPETALGAGPPAERVPSQTRSRRAL